MKWAPILLCCLICFCLGNAWTILPAISNYIIDDQIYKISNSFYAVLNGLLVLASVFISIGAGFIGKKMRMKPVLLYGIIACSVALLFLVIAQLNLSEFKLYVMLSQIVLGLGIGIILTALNVYLVLLIPDATAMVLTGVYSCVNLGSFSCPLFVNYLFGNANWWMHALFISCLFIILLLLCTKFLPNLFDKAGRAHVKFIEKKDISADLIIFILIMLLFALVEISFTSWGTLFLHTSKKLSLKASNLGLSIFWVNVGVFHLITCLLVKWIKPKFIFQTLPIFIIGGLIFSHFAKGDTQSFIIMILLGIGCSAFFSLCINAAEKRFKHIKEFVSGSMVTAYFLGSLFGSILIGLTYRKQFLTLDHIFLLMAFISIIFFILILYEQRSKVT